jgi:hypothetical protein
MLPDSKVCCVFIVLKHNSNYFSEMGHKASNLNLEFTDKELTALQEKGTPYLMSLYHLIILNYLNIKYKVIRTTKEDKDISFDGFQ